MSSSPFRRMVEGNKKEVLCRIGSLTFYISPAMYSSLVAWASDDPEWRRRLIDLIAAYGEDSVAIFNPLATHR